MQRRALTASGASRLFRRCTLFGAGWIVLLALSVGTTDAQPIGARFPGPDSLTKDWVRMTSGEWVRGEIHVLRDQDLSFESEEFDDMVLDWTNVAEMRSARILTFVFTGQRIVAGTVHLMGDSLRITSAGSEQAWPRSELVSIIEGRPSEWNFWGLKANLQFIARSGNTNQTDFHTDALLRRESPRSRLDVFSDANWGEIESARTVDNQRVGSRIDFYLTRNFFFRAADVTVYRDRFQNIGNRLNASTGAGVFLIRRSALEWAVGLSAGYTRTHYSSVLPGENQTEQGGSITPSLAVESEPTTDVDLDFSYYAQVGLPDPSQTFHHLEVVFSLDFFSIFDLSATFAYDRTESPKANEDGTIPKRDDFRTALGFGIDI